MKLLISLLIIIGTIILIKKEQSKAEKINVKKKVTIAELKDMLDKSGKKYKREYVEIEGKVKTDNLKETPFYKRKVAYYYATISRVRNIRQPYEDSDGKKRIRTAEEKEVRYSTESREKLKIVDDSEISEVIIDGYDVQDKLTTNTYMSKKDFEKSEYAKLFKWDKIDNEAIRFDFSEKIILPNQKIYIVGDACKVGDEIHIKRPNNMTTPFVMTTQSKEKYTDLKEKYLKSTIMAYVLVALILILCLNFVL